MSTHDTTEDSLTDRLVSTAVVAVLECEEISNSPDSWLRPLVLGIQGVLAAELIALEQLARRPLSLQDAVAFILQGAEA